MHRHDGILLELPALPAGVTRKALLDFVRSGLSDAGYNRLGLARGVSACSIIRVTDLASGSSRLQGLVRIAPARAGMAAIETLGGRELLGTPMEIRRYVHRSSFDHDGEPQPHELAHRPSLMKIELLDH